MKRSLFAVIAVLAFFGSVKAEPIAGRMWENVNLTVLLSPQFSFTVMPGHRWEFSRDTGATRDTYFYELFVGPTYTTNISENLKFKLPVWYYYMRFPNRFTDTYTSSHNLEVLPIFELKLSKDLMVSSRSIFHNTFYAGAYGGAGWSTLLREMILINYTINPNCTAFIGDELFIGLITDANNAGVYGPGFSPSGIDENRVIAGFNYKVTNEFSVTPQYIYSTTYSASAGVNNAANGVANLSAHNFYLTLTYVLKMF